MPLTADKLIDKEIYNGNKTTKGYSAVGLPIKTFSPGQSLGIVYSWINKPALKGYALMFYEDAKNFKKPYFIRFVDGPFKATAEIKKLQQKEKIAEEKEQLKDKGPFAFYLEKYGPYVLGTIILIAIIKKKL
jgi:hypothetical protein